MDKLRHKILCVWILNDNEWNEKPIFQLWKMFIVTYGQKHSVYQLTNHAILHSSFSLCSVHASYFFLFVQSFNLDLILNSIDEFFLLLFFHHFFLNCRYIAVTQPIKYAKHKNSLRIFVTILLVWAISIAIGSPIVLGLNNTPNRVPDICAFFNTNFIIFSSLVSFYIPCIIMVFLYWNIFKVSKCCHLPYRRPFFGGPSTLFILIKSISL